MRTEFGSPINYFLMLENDEIHVNDLLDRNIQIKFELPMSELWKY